MLQIPLSDEAWQKVCHLFDYTVSNKPSRPRRHPRAVLDAILWIPLNDEKWHRLLATFPPAQTCYLKWLEWKRSGILARVFDELSKESGAPDTLSETINTQ
ncbi:MAG: hypothetical protein CPDRYMAC_1112 [uncultured Paraburkholderia sp.]|nr:MAG: hypothetical protein CPDRYDRY_1089 [uncultured Paraburkholderia sp.]CAH2915962.1 MAG: hypothetical protein CPDRYMAC_1112 [uncultured Paraburkholderia sp.]